MTEQQIQLLQKELHNELLKAAKEAKIIGYNPTLFNQMLANEGGFKVAKKLIHKTSSGFEKLWELNRLDLSTEAVILHPKFNVLFTQEEIAVAKARLKEFGYATGDILPQLQPSGREREQHVLPVGRKSLRKLRHIVYQTKDGLMVIYIVLNIKSLVSKNR